jgi:hypothetical protein
VHKLRGGGIVPCLGYLLRKINKYVTKRTRKNGDSNRFGVTVMITGMKMLYQRKILYGRQ